MNKHHSPSPSFLRGAQEDLETTYSQIKHGSLRDDGLSSQDTERRLTWEEIVEQCLRFRERIHGLIRCRPVQYIEYRQQLSKPNGFLATQRMQSQLPRDCFAEARPSACRRGPGDLNRMAHMVRGHWTERPTWRATWHYSTHDPWHWQSWKSREPSRGQQGRQKTFLES